jgi:glycosyltransferase involved in cell wall biosynthesis
MQETTFPVRICIHDDASTDGTTEMLANYESMFPGLIQVFYQPVNTFAHPLRVELQSTYRSWTEQGKYIALCEGDDYWTDPHKLQKQVEYLENHPETTLCVHDVQIVHEGIVPPRERFYNVPREGDFEFTYADYFDNHFFHTASKVFRVPEDKARYAEYVSRVRSGDLMSNHMLLSAGKGYFFKEKMALKRRNKGGYTSSSEYKRLRAMDYYVLWQNIAAFAPESHQKKVKRKLSELERGLAKKALRDGKWWKTIKFAWKALTNHPSWLFDRI